MDLLTTYAYFWGSLVGVIFVLALFYFYPIYRKEMLIAGGFVGVYGVLSEYWFFRDYWQPQLIIPFGRFGGIEDLMFGFAAGAMGAVVYNLLTRKRLRYKYKPRAWIYSLGFFIGTLSFILLVENLEINSILASVAGLSIVAGIIVSVRPDLWRNCVVSALTFGLVLVGLEGAMLLFLNAYLPSYYLLHGTAPVLLGLFPVTELIWGIAFGAVVGPLYEFAVGRGYIKART